MLCDVLPELAQEIKVNLRKIARGELSEQIAGLLIYIVAAIVGHGDAAGSTAYQVGN